MLKECEEEWPYLSKVSARVGSEMQTPEELLLLKLSQFETLNAFLRLICVRQYITVVKPNPEV